ncbi:hypothetical protein H6F76_17470 [Leptolyngbya sp. FACHB-321]|uniref:hypothetical protein n=1 Tax=Leptolyngbya sp. FACHB-321 TaxID=2692807 RepID=UPI0016864735|nr:hypothetical protein [Leptolyngbya sp. FACHB-321]MBD2036800.1 hypothetical protein [Leptolyngbya sp. FACHB-321]
MAVVVEGAIAVFRSCLTTCSAVQPLQGIDVDREFEFSNTLTIAAIARVQRVK